MTPGDIADRVAIAELVANLCRTVDGDDPHAFAANFTEDGVLVGSDGPIEGRQTICDWVVPALGRVVHTTSDSIIEIDGDTARHECALVVYTRAPSGELHGVRLVGRYRDELRRTADGWRVAHRVVDRGAYPVQA